MKCLIGVLSTQQTEKSQLTQREIAALVNLCITHHVHPDVESNSSCLPMNEEYVGICFLVVQTVCEQPETTSYKQS